MGKDESENGTIAAEMGRENRRLSVEFTEISESYRPPLPKS